VVALVAGRGLLLNRPAAGDAVPAVTLAFEPSQQVRGVLRIRGAVALIIQPVGG
jgi:hypothetical protein